MSEFPGGVIVDVGSKVTWGDAVHRNPGRCQFGQPLAAPWTRSGPRYAVCITRLSPEPPKSGEARRTEVVRVPREIAECLLQKSPVCG